MKIEGRCRNCGRDFPIDLVVEPPETAGACPFCGKVLDAEYLPLLVETLITLQRVGGQIVNILERARSVGEGLDIDAESVLAPIRSALGTRAAASAERRATRGASLAEGSPAR